MAVDKDAKVMAWQILTDINSLNDGDQIIIVAKDYNRAIGTTQNTNNRSESTIVKNSDGTVTLGTDTQVITVEKVDGVYCLCVGDSQYLYAADGTAKNNWLKTQAKKDVCQWIIEISETGVATIKAADSTILRNTLMYNYSSTLFSCYASGQKDICIYVYAEK